MSEPILNEQLSAYIDGELTDAEAAELEALLERDAALRADLDALEGVSALLRQHGAVSAPEGFRERVIALVASEPMPLVAPWWRRPFGVPVEGLAVAAAAVLVVGVSLGTGALTVGSGAPADKSAGAADTRPIASRSAADPAPAADPAADLPPIADPASIADASQAPAAQPDAADTRSTPRPAPAKDASPPLATRKGSTPKGAEPATTEPPPAPAEQIAEQAAVASAAPDEPDKKGKMFPVPYRYTLTTADPEILAALQRLAGKYSGDVSRQGARTRGGDTVDGTYLVQIPNTALAEFGDALRSLGQVQETADGSWYGGGPTVRVQVDIRLAGEPPGSADRPASMPAQ